MPWTPTSFEELQNYARGKGWSEDFDRWRDTPEVVMDWVNRYWDANRGGFRNEHYQTEANNPAFQGVFEKPIDLPEGYAQYGQGYISKTDPAWQRHMAAINGGGVAQQQPGMTPQSLQEMLQGLFKQGFNIYQNTPLVGMLQNQGGFLRQYDQTPGDGKAGVSGGVMGGGGIWYQRPQTNAAMAQPGGNMAAPAPATGARAGVPLTAGRTGGAAVTSPLTNTLAPMQQMQPLEGGGLTNMMRQRQRQPGMWF
jgi:hypothetical protein